MATSTPAIIQNRFNSQGAISSASPGDFDSISGSGSQRKVPVGARLTSDTHPFGWSCYGEQLLGEYDTSAYDFATTSYMLQGWFYLDEVNENNELQLMHFEYGGNSRQYLTRHVDGRVRFQIGDASYATALSAGNFPAGKWMWFGVVFTKGHSSLGRLKFSVYHKTIGEDMVQLLDSDEIGYANASLPFTKAVIGYYEAGGGVTSKGRLAMPGIYATGGWYEQDSATYPTDIAEPYVGDLAIHVDPYWGNDTNDGVSSQSPIKTTNCLRNLIPAMPTKTGAYAAYDHELVINTYYAPLLVNGMTGNIDNSNTVGLTIRPPDPATTTRGTAWRTVIQEDVVGSSTFIDIQCETVIEADEFTLTTDQTYTYEFTYPESHSMIRSTVYEDHKPLASQSSIAAVESTPGSYYTDGTTLYVHSLNSSDLTTSDEVMRYTAAFNDSATPEPALKLGKDMTIQCLRMGGTADYLKSADATGGTYLISSGTIDIGTCTLTDIFLYHGSKHSIGFVTSSYADVTMRRVQCEQQVCQGSSNATPWVFFAGSGGIANSQTYTLIDCWIDRIYGLIGSVAGDPDRTNDALYSHGVDGTPTFLQKVTVTDCDFGATGKISLNNISDFEMTGATFAGGYCNSTTGIVSNVSVYGSLFNARNCVVSSAVFHTNTYASWTNGSGHQVRGTNDFVCCTFDFRAGSVAGGATNNSDDRLFQLDSGGSWNDFYSYGNVFLFNQDRNPLLYKVSTANLSEITSDYNVFECDADVAVAYVDSVAVTFSEWQALGMDANSVRVDPGTMTMTAGTWAPEAGDIVRNMVPAHGSLTMPTESFGGGDRPYGNSYDAGAVEYAPTISLPVTHKMVQQVIAIAEGGGL